MKLLMVSLGCDKNLVDSEEMSGILLKKGVSFTDDEREADIIVINTCAFIGDAKEESINTILELAQNKESRGGRCKALIVSGCLAQRYSSEIKKELPEVDAVVGTTAYDQIWEAVEAALSGEKPWLLRDINTPRGPSGNRVLSGGGHSAYLKIAEGCDKRCTYCIIPSMRGSYRSVPMEELIREAERLALRSVKELILIAQETTVYGKDLYGEKRLPELIKRLADIKGIEWIRLMYCYPEEITDELVETIKNEPKVCNYIDMPIQHASDRILRAMGRRTDGESLRLLIERLRAEIPDITLRTTIITGFPGETQEDFVKLYNFIDEMEFDRLGVFPYSEEEGTVAAGFSAKVEQAVKEARRDEIMELQREIAWEKAEKAAGRRLKAFIEGELSEDGVYVGRTYMDAPDVDGMIFVNSERRHLSGDIIEVLVTGASGYDLKGEEIYEPSE
ncbi:MAG TPA: 30S ribosomal protein S12 methylthiotransferase RimO [Lachnospiraceae bacterium]|nr:30S ribosomal protein S12 methylthiotransferase RimO [Lachnospiraceae bacterium]